MSRKLGKGLIAVALSLVCVAVAAWMTSAAPIAAPVQPTSDDKLDRILDKLEGLDRRIRILETKLDHPASACTSSTSWDKVVANVVNTLVGAHVINVYSSDPNRRIQELLNDSEDLRQIELEWERIWGKDAPAHLTPERVDGAIQ
jgi:hypothetical protein